MTATASKGMKTANTAAEIAIQLHLLNVWLAGRLTATIRLLCRHLFSHTKGLSFIDHEQLPAKDSAFRFARFN